MANAENKAPVDPKGQDEAVVDDTPISPSRPDARRKNSLEQHLKSRPPRAELIDREALVLCVCHVCVC
jgi:hypothetical protein